MADKRGQAEAFAKYANGVFILKEDYEKLLNDQRRMKDLEQQLSDISKVQGEFRESTSPFNIFRKMIQRSPANRRRPPQKNTDRTDKTDKTTDQTSTDHDSRVER